MRRRAEPAEPAEPAGPEPESDPELGAGRGGRFEAASAALPRGWRRAALYAGLLVLAGVASRATIFPGFELPALSVVAGVNAAFLVAAAGRRQRAAWCVGIAGASFAVRLLVGLPVVSSVVVALALALGAAVFATLLRGHPLAPRRRGVVPEIVAVAAAAAVAGGIVVAIGAWLGDIPGLALEAAVVRAGADLTGVLVVVPLVYAVPALWRSLSPRQIGELVAFAAAVALTLHVGFMASGTFLVGRYLALGVLLFAVVRCGRPAAWVLPAVWAPLTIWYARHGYGPWTDDTASAMQPVVGTQLYNLTTITLAWLVADLLDERAGAHRALARAHEALEARVADRTAELATALDELHDEVGQRRRAEARYRAIFADSTSAMLLIDPEAGGRIVDANRAAAAWYGWSHDELCARRIADINTASAAEVRAEMARARELHRNVFEFRHRRADGSVRDVEVHSGPIEVDGRTLLYSIVHDVTERRQSQELTDLVFEVSADPLCTIGLRDGRFERVNPAWERVTGWSAAELCRRHFAELVLPEDRGRVAEAEAALAAGRVVLGFECRFRCRDGAYRWLQWNSASLRDRGLIVGIARDVTAQKETEAQLVRQALHDPLTGLANRQLLHDRLRVALDGLDRRPGAVAVLYLDLDRFKEINDTLGHEAGDLVLVEVAHRLGDNVRAVDTVARLAGDEFVILCPDLDGERIGLVANRLLAALGQPMAIGGRVEMGASIGIAVARERGVGSGELLRRADRALYRAKEQGRNRWEQHPDEVALDDSRGTIPDDLRRALEADGLRLE